MSAATAAARAGIDRRALAGLATGHGLADLCQGAVPALLPFLIAQRGLSLAAATALLTAATIGSSIVQPLFGLWADRLSSPLLIPGGLVLGAAGLGAVGLCGSYAALAVVLAISGLGVAAFHPEGARCANLASGDRRARGMSYFSVGGNLGFALGPALATPLVLTLGLGATPLLAAPGLLAAAFAGREVSRLHAGRPPRHRDPASRPPTRGRAFSRLAAAAVVRTGAFFALQAFMPIYLIDRFGAGRWAGGAALTLMLLAGALGTIVGGRCADRFGRRLVLVHAMAPLTVALLVLPHLGAAGFVALVAVAGFLVDAPFSTTVVLGQEYLPGREGLASGITLGLAIGLGGLLATGLGLLADATSLATALAALPVLSGAGLALALTLPEPTRG